MSERQKALQNKLWAIHAEQARKEIVQALGVSPSDIVFLDMDESAAFATRFRECDVGPSIQGTSADFWARADSMWSEGETLVLLLNSWQQTGFAKLRYGMLRNGAQALQAKLGPDIFVAAPALERGAVLDVGEVETLLRFWGDRQA